MWMICSSLDQMTLLVDDFKLRMQNEFNMSDLGIMSSLLGLQIEQKGDCIMLH